jgi:hypothetical protein
MGLRVWTTWSGCACWRDPLLSLCRPGWLAAWEWIVGVRGLRASGCPQSTAGDAVPAAIGAACCLRLWSACRWLAVPRPRRRS